MKLLLYCTKAKPYLRDYRGKAIYNRFVVSPSDRPFTSDDTQPILNGKIVAECDFEVEEIKYSVATLIHSRLTLKKLDDYLQGKNGYAIHIKNLHIFDKPKELDDYYYSRKGVFRTLGKAPQNMMYVQEVVPFKEEHLIKGVLQEFRGNRVNEYILISIQPQWLCKILNGEKTIEVRKKVLKEMLK